MDAKTDEFDLEKFERGEGRRRGGT